MDRQHTSCLPNGACPYIQTNGPLSKRTGWEATGWAGGSRQGVLDEISLIISWESTLSTCMFLTFILFWHSFQFQKGMNTKWSNWTSWIYTCLGPWIFSYHPKSFSQASWWLDHCHELVEWAQPPNQDPFYNPFTPILYMDYQGQQDIKAVFLIKPYWM